AHATRTSETYTLSLHDALPISRRSCPGLVGRRGGEEVAAQAGEREHGVAALSRLGIGGEARERLVDRRQQVGIVGRRLIDRAARSEEHTSELQSQSNLVCRLLL